MNKVKVIGGFGELCNNDTQYHTQNRIYDIDGISPSLNTFVQGAYIYDDRGDDMKEPIKYFSLFSGIGGFECGIMKSRLNAECVGYSEVDKFADSVYSKQFPKHKGYGDATQIDTRKLPNFDFLVGGFPCQPFSICGKRKGFEDTRGTLFFEIARILADKRPKYFLFENVKGLLSHNNGETFQTILKVFNEQGYDVSWEVRNSQEFLPQKRERVFLKGYSRDRCGKEILHQSKRLQ